MLNVRNLEDSELLERTKNLATQEREITLNVLHHLKEIDARKLFLERGFSSLFEFCVKELHYSEGSASRRISPMRLIRDLPEVEQKIKENKVNLSTLSLLHSHIRREEKTQRIEIPKEEKLDLLVQIENKSQEACERELLKHSSQPVRPAERERVVSENFTEIKFIASKELMQKFKALKNLMAHSKANPTWNEFFESLSEIAIKKLDPRNEAKASSKATAAAAKRGVTKDSRHIPRGMRARIWIRDGGRCQFVDVANGRKCENSFALQIDHIHPFSLGGETREENLRLLCRAHNAFLAGQIFGNIPKSVSRGSTSFR